jgi:hypothetical protein
MMDENFSYFLNALSLIIKSRIFYITKSQKTSQLKNKEVDELEKKDKIVCITSDSVVIIFHGMEKIKQKIHFDEIKNLEVDLNDEKHVRINLVKEFYIVSQVDLSLINREDFIEKLSRYYKILSIQETGKLKELKINFVKLSEPKKSEGETDNKLSQCEMLKHFLPKFSTIYNLDNYSFFLKKGFEKLDKNTFFFPKTKNNYLSAKLLIEISDEKPIEGLSIEDEYDLSFSSHKRYYNYMNKNFLVKNYFTLLNSAFIKTSNFNKDNSVWEGWKIKTRTKKTNSSSSRNSCNHNIIFIFLRRKYIPPLSETYQDITLILLEEYEDDSDYEISPFSNELIDNLANSFTPVRIEAYNKDCIKLIKNKFNHFLMDADSYNYFLNDVKIIGEDAIKLGLNFTFKIILIIQDYSSNFAKKIKKRFFKKIETARELFCDNYYDIKTYERKIKEMDFENIIRSGEEFFKSHFNNCDKKDLELLLESKLWDFFVYCVDGGLTFNLITLKTIISVYRKKPQIANLEWVLNKLLNLRIVSTKDQILPSNISSVINDYNSVKEIYFNEDTMVALIETNVLPKLQGIESELTYAQFLKFLLTRNFSNKILTAIYFYLKLLSKKTKSDNVEVEGIKNELKSDVKEKDEMNLYEMDFYSLKTNLKILVPIFFKIYSNSNNSPIILTIACKCLNFFSNLDSMVKIDLINQECLGVIKDHLSSPDEKLIFASVKLIISLLSDATDAINKILKKNPKILKRLLKIIKGSSIPGVYFSYKTVVLVLNLIVLLITHPTAKVREKLCNDEGKKFTKYFINHLQYNQNTQPDDFENTLPIQEKVIDVFYILINKNIEYRNYIENNFKIAEILDKKFEKFCVFAEIRMNTEKDPKANDRMYSNETIDNYIKFIFVMLKFLKRFVSNDLQIINKVRTNCFNIINGIILIKENSSKDFFRFLVEDSEDLYKLLYDE